MSQGYSLHIGLNHVDPAGYNGWSGQLAGCLNDAHAMENICSQQGFTTSLLLDEQANAAAVLAAISDLAGKAVAGDTVVISYSGHGGQVPDTTGTEDDGQCETWVCFDRMVVDKELFAKWSDFEAGVHVEVFSDSCHSGTVIRELIVTTGSDGAPDAEQANQLKIAPVVLRDYNTVFKPAAVAQDRAMSMAKVSRSTPPPAAAARPYARMIPPALALALFRRDYALYSRVQKRPGPIACSVALISGCQDNQTSADGTNNGLFTEKLLQVWDSGNFAGNYSQFYKAILALMPADQTPNYLEVGAPDAAMECSRPLTLVSGGATSSSPPKISGPASISRGDPAPSFSVDAGSDRNYVVEVATDTALFADSSGRTPDNFFASWADGPRLTDPTYTLPDAAWQCLRAAERIYYRAGSTTSATGWDNYLVSTDDADASNAPFIAVSASADAGGTGQPSDGGTTGARPMVSIVAPDSWDRTNSTGPTFSINSSLPYLIVEVATDPAQFADSSGRTSGNFYATWDDSSQPARLSPGDFTLPDTAWQALCAADRLYYRAGATSSETGWDDYIVSTDDADASSAPAVSLGARGRSGPPKTDGGSASDGGSSRSRKKDKRLVPA